MSGRTLDDCSRQPALPTRLRRRGPGASLLCLAAVAAMSAQPAAARREVPPVKGIYYGSFSNSNGRFMPAEIRLTWQNGKRVAGWLVLSAAYPEIPIDGTVSPSGDLRLQGRKRTHNATWRVRLTASCSEGPDTRTMVIRGGYRIAGTTNERGECEVIGLNDAH